MRFIQKKMKRRIAVCITALILVLLTVLLSRETIVFAADQNGEQNVGNTSGQESETQPPAGIKGTWILKNGKYYYSGNDGKILKKCGMVKIGKYYYYLTKNYSRATGFRKVKGSWYYFNKKTGRRYEKVGWKTIKKKKYYFQKNHAVATGVTKIGGKKYSFSAKGVLEKNKRPFKFGSKYYRTDDNGVLIKSSKLQAQCSEVTWKFINAHSNASMSNAARFRACFNYMEAYSVFHYRPFNAALFKGKEWKYRMTIQMLRDHDGDCHHFACSIASIARELGYHPYVVVTAGDHSFVMIDGKYYDNMGALFGASSHSAYEIFKKQKF